jgi:hypothetical protein
MRVSAVNEKMHARGPIFPAAGSKESDSWSLEWEVFAPRRYNISIPIICSTLVVLITRLAPHDLLLRFRKAR